MKHNSMFKLVEKGVLIAVLFGFSSACLGQSEDNESPTVFTSKDYQLEVAYDESWTKIKPSSNEILMMVEYNKTPGSAPRCNVSVFPNPTEWQDPDFWTEEFKKPGAAKEFGDNLPGVDKSTFVSYRESKMGGVPAIEIEFDMTMAFPEGAVSGKGLTLHTTRGKWVYLSVCMAPKETFDERKLDFMKFFSGIKFVESPGK